MGDAQYINKDLISYCSSDLDQAMIYRLEFASDERRDYFESRIDALFNSHRCVHDRLCRVVGPRVSRREESFITTLSGRVTMGMSGRSSLN